jgi:hypothetical protein
MFEALENNPKLRERVLGLTAIGATLLGGAIGVDTMLTSGWQLGGTEASARPVIYADALPQIQDDADRDWSSVPPRPVQLAAATTPANDAIVSEDLKEQTTGAVTTAAYQPEPLAPLPEIQLPTVMQPPQQAAQADSDREFQAIENEIRQAEGALAPDASGDGSSKPDSLSPPPGEPS